MFYHEQLYCHLSPTRFIVSYAAKFIRKDMFEPITYLTILIFSAYLGKRWTSRSGDRGLKPYPEQFVVSLSKALDQHCSNRLG